MKTNYFLRTALLAATILGTGSLFSQVAKTSNFVENVSPVHGVDGSNNPTMEDFTFAFENGASWGDYNNDGYLDLIVAGVSNSWVKTTILYKNNGDGTFTKITTPFPQLDAASITWIDYDNDGNLDVILTGKDDIGYLTFLYRNLGAAQNYEFSQVTDGVGFANMNNGGGNNANRYAAAGDYNNDGWTDFYIQGKNESGIQSYLYKNLKGKGFELVANPVNGTDPLTPIYGGTATWGDVDKDGYLDLIVNGQFVDGAPNSDALTPQPTDITLVYINKQDGTFKTPIADYDGSVQGDVACLDYNNDGYPDFLRTGVGGKYSYPEGPTGPNPWDWSWHSDIFENSGSGTFSIVPAIQNGMPAGKQQASIAIGDVNNDGYEDVLYMNADPNSIFLNNYGDQTFKKYDLTYTKPVGGDSEANYSYKGNQWGGTACLVDYDRDGNLDAFTAAYGFTPRLMRNTLAEDVTGNQAPTAPANLSSSVSDGVVTFSWSAGSDDTTPAEALKYNLYVKKNGSDLASFVLPADSITGRLKVNETLAPIVSTSYKISGLDAGNYAFGVQAIDNSKVGSTFAKGTFTINSSSINSELANKIGVVSGTGKITITAEAGLDGAVSVCTASGATVYSKSGKISNSVVSLSPGFYVVKVSSGKNTVVKKAVVK